MTALYSTEPVTILGVRWRYAFDRFGHGEYEYFSEHAKCWYLRCLYNHQKFGLVTIAELNRALYQPNRSAINAARDAIKGAPRNMSHSAEQAAEHFHLVSQSANMQFNLI